MLELGRVKSIKEEGIWITVPKLEIELKITPILQSDFEKIKKEYTSITFDKKSHEKIYVEDQEKREKAFNNLILESVVDWKGIVDKDKNEITFERSKFKLLLDEYGLVKVDFDENGEEITFSAWLIKQLLNIDLFTSSVKDEEKNL